MIEPAPDGARLPEQIARHRAGGVGTWLDDCSAGASRAELVAPVSAGHRGAHP